MAMGAVASRRWQSPLVFVNKVLWAPTPLLERLFSLCSGELSSYNRDCVARGALRRLLAGPSQM